jgi:hypothetical protein
MSVTGCENKHHCNHVCVRLFELAVCVNIVLLIRVFCVVPYSLSVLASLSLVANTLILCHFRRNVSSASSNVYKYDTDQRRTS